MKAYSVGELSSILKACFENPSFSKIPVYGEVYSIRLGKFSYIDLGDQGSNQSNAPLLRCAFSCFYNNDYHLEDIQVGDVILIEGKLSYYPHGSSVTLWGNKVEILKNQEGKNLLAKKKTLEKLEKLGYLDEKRKRKIPNYCKKIAILTSKDGAAYQDILKTLHDRFPVSSVLYPCIVQGENAAKSMTKALLEAQKEDYDCILLGRGGGSKTDLSCFDDEKLSLAIAESKCPVITCIGHTIDTAIADRVSDIKAITPTEGASLINPSLSDVISRREEFLSSLKEAYQNVLRSYALSCENYQTKLESLSPDNRVLMKKKDALSFSNQLSLIYLSLLKRKKDATDNLKQNILLSYQSLLQRKKEQAVHFQELIEQENPIRYLSFSCLYKEGKKVTSVKDLNVEDEILITLLDGRVKAKITEK